jgi:hypothetical protein
VKGIMAGPKDVLARSYRLACATCGGVYRRDRFASGAYAWRFPEHEDGAEAAPGIPATAPSPACRGHEADALCRYHVARRTAERWAAAAPHSPPEAPAGFVTLVLTPLVLPLRRIDELRPQAAVTHAHRAMRLGFGRLAPDEITAIRTFGHVDLGLVLDLRQPDARRTTWVVPHVHALVAGVGRARLSRVLRGVVAATRLVPYPKHVAGIWDGRGALQYARKHVDDLRVRLLRTADDGREQDYPTAPTPWQRGMLRGWFARVCTAELELLMGLQRKGSALVAYPMRLREAGR